MVHNLGAEIKIPYDHGDSGSSHPRTPQGESLNTVSGGIQRGNPKTEPDPTSSPKALSDHAKTLSPIFLLAKVCLGRFKVLQAVLNGSQSDKHEQLGLDLDFIRLTIEDTQARFKAWGSNIAAFHNGALRTSLDFRLAEAPGMRRRTLQMLEDLQEYLRDATSIIVGEKTNETWSLNDTSDSSDYSEEEKSHQKGKEGNLKQNEVSSDLDELLKAITASNGSLMKLSIVIRSSATRDDYLKAASRYKTWSPYPDIGHVREKYGSANRMSDWLLERLGKAITRRRQFLKYRIEHNDKLAGTWDEGEGEGRRDKPEKTIVASTKATTFVGENILQNILAVGSDAGNSFGSQTSYEATIYEGDGAPRMLTVPPPPKLAFPNVRFEYGEPFTCPYCFTEQVVKNKGAWKKHVFRDLKPYVCTFIGCELLMFRSRNEWFAHELQAHRREWVCQFCQQAAFPTASAFSKHTRLSHQAILASSSLEALVLQSEEPVDNFSSTACPLCNDWEADLERKQANLAAILPSPENPEKSHLSGKLKLFRRHLGRHMEQLALFALPSNDTEDLEDDSTDEEKEESATRDQSEEVQGESSDEGGEDEPEQILERAHEASTPRVLDMSKDELSKYVKQEDENKFRCPFPDCRKLFKGKHFCRKHVENRHPEWLKGLNTAIVSRAYEKPTNKEAEEKAALEEKFEEEKKAAQARGAENARKQIEAERKKAEERAAEDKVRAEVREAVFNAEMKSKEAVLQAQKEIKEAVVKAKREAKEAVEKAEKDAKASIDRSQALKDEDKKKPIRFRDAVGRKFSFPFHLCSTWAGMEKVVRQAFLYSDVLGPHVQEGHYDLIGPNGELILPQVWETVIEPDWEISMHMWPMPDESSTTSPPPGHQFDPHRPASRHDGRRRVAGPPSPPPGWIPGPPPPPPLG